MKILSTIQIAKLLVRLYHCIHKTTAICSIYYIPSINRYQLSFGSLDEKVSAYNPFRFIDSFVDAIDIDSLGLEKVNGEHSLIMLVYNITRVKNILPIATLSELLKTWKPNYKGILLLLQNWLKKSRFEPLYFLEEKKLLQKIAA